MITSEASDSLALSLIQNVWYNRLAFTLAGDYRVTSESRISRR